MPFTFSHPALIAPIYHLHKRYFSLTGLVMGSLAPDFEYFFKMTKRESQFSHSLPGLFWFDLPLSIFLALVYHLVIRDPLINNMPRFLFRRFSKFRYTNWAAYAKENWWVVIFSILIGSSSHLLWDFFVHSNYQLIQKNPVAILHVNAHDFRIENYDVFNYINSFVGLMILIKIIWDIPLSPPDKRNQVSLSYWILISAISTFIIGFRLIIVPPLYIDDIIVTVIAAFLIALLLMSVLETRKTLLQANNHGSLE